MEFILVHVIPRFLLDLVCVASIDNDTEYKSYKHVTNHSLHSHLLQFYHAKSNKTMGTLVI